MRCIKNIYKIFYFSLFFLYQAFSLSQYPPTPLPTLQTTPSTRELTFEYMNGALAASQALQDFAVEKIWNPTFLESNPKIAKAILQYQNNKIGMQAKKLNLNNLTAKEIHYFLLKQGFFHIREGIKIKDKWLLRSGELVTELDHANTVAHDIYLHADGSMIRVKPEGIPTQLSLPRKHPYYIKSVLLDKVGVCHIDTCEYNYEFTNEAFKLTTNGIPVPSSPGNALKYPSISYNAPYQNEKQVAFLAGWADAIMASCHNLL